MKTIEIDEKQPKTCLESLIMQLGPDMLRYYAQMNNDQLNMAIDQEERIRSLHESAHDVLAKIREVKRILDCARKIKGEAQPHAKNL